jgi:hypothetical protein
MTISVPIQWIGGCVWALVTYLDFSKRDAPDVQVSKKTAQGDWLDGVCGGLCNFSSWSMERRTVEAFWFLSNGLATAAVFLVWRNGDDGDVGPNLYRWLLTLYVLNAVFVKLYWVCMWQEKSYYLAILFLFLGVGASAVFIGILATAMKYGPDTAGATSDFTLAISLFSIYTTWLLIAFFYTGVFVNKHHKDSRGGGGGGGGGGKPQKGSGSSAGAYRPLPTSVV